MTDAGNACLRNWRGRETFSRRSLKLRGINEFCGDVDWFIKNENHIYRVYRKATNQKLLRSSDLRWGDEEFTGEKID